jgi:predicted nucleic acid-binding protein
MLVVVSDASPIHYLALIGESELLPALYGSVLIPDSVAAELTHLRTPEVVKQWIGGRPAWLEVARPTQPPSDVMAHLDRGERDALLLAIETKADLVLMDERDGVEEAARLGLRVTGTLGVLDQAATKELIDLPSALNRLRATNFRVSPVLLEGLLADHALRRRKSK